MSELRLLVVGVDLWDWLLCQSMESTGFSPFQTCGTSQKRSGGNGSVAVKRISRTLRMMAFGGHKEIHYNTVNSALY